MHMPKQKPPTTSVTIFSIMGSSWTFHVCSKSTILELKLRLMMKTKIDMETIQLMHRQTLLHDDARIEEFASHELELQMVIDVKSGFNIVK